VSFRRASRGRDLAGRRKKSARTRRAYRLNVAHFMRTLGVTTPEQLRQLDYHAVIAWERMMREEQGAAASTVRRRLAALSSVFKHLVRHGAAGRNPVVDVTRPAINRAEVMTCPRRSGPPNVRVRRHWAGDRNGTQASQAGGDRWQAAAG
jgi:site-specific recombinase XerC